MVIDVCDSSPPIVTPMSPSEIPSAERPTKAGPIESEILDGDSDTLEINGTGFYFCRQNIDTNSTKIG